MVYILPGLFFFQGYSFFKVLQTVA